MLKKSSNQDPVAQRVHEIARFFLTYYRAGLAPMFYPGLVELPDGQAREYTIKDRANGVTTTRKGTSRWRCACAAGVDCLEPGKHPMKQPGLPSEQSIDDALDQLVKCNDLTVERIEALVAPIMDKLGDVSIALRPAMAHPRAQFVLIDVDAQDALPELLKRWDEAARVDAKALGVSFSDMSATRFVFETGGGGVQILAQGDRQLVTGKECGHPHIDVRAAGGSGRSIAPPSRHHTGGSYKWHPGCFERIEAAVQAGEDAFNTLPIVPQGVVAWLRTKGKPLAAEQGAPQARRKPGRPRTNPLPDPDTPKRPRGRPRNEVEPADFAATVQAMHDDACLAEAAAFWESEEVHGGANGTPVPQSQEVEGVEYREESPKARPKAKKKEPPPPLDRYSDGFEPVEAIRQYLAQTSPEGNDHRNRTVNTVLSFANHHDVDDDDARECLFAWIEGHSEYGKASERRAMLDRIGKSIRSRQSVFKSYSSAAGEFKKAGVELPIGESLGVSFGSFDKYRHLSTVYYDVQADTFKYLNEHANSREPGKEDLNIRGNASIRLCSTDKRYFKKIVLRIGGEDVEMPLHEAVVKYFVVAMTDNDPHKPQGFYKSTNGAIHYNRSGYAFNVVRNESGFIVPTVAGLDACDYTDDELEAAIMRGAQGPFMQAVQALLPGNAGIEGYTPDCYMPLCQIAASSPLRRSVTSRVFCYYGAGGAGKSTITGLIRAFAGGDGVKTLTERSLSIGFLPAGAASLYHGQDIDFIKDNTNSKDNQTKLKNVIRLSGESEIAVESKGKDATTVQRSGFIMLDGNNFKLLDRQDTAHTRRFEFVDFFAANHTPLSSAKHAKVLGVCRNVLNYVCYGKRPRLVSSGDMSLDEQIDAMISPNGYRSSLNYSNMLDGVFSEGVHQAVLDFFLFVNNIDLEQLNFDPSGPARDYSKNSYHLRASRDAWDYQPDKSGKLRVAGGAVDVESAPAITRALEDAVESIQPFARIEYEGESVVIVSVHDVAQRIVEAGAEPPRPKALVSYLEGTTPGLRAVRLADRDEFIGSDDRKIVKAGGRAIAVSLLAYCPGDKNCEVLRKLTFSNRLIDDIAKTYGKLAAAQSNDDTPVSDVPDELLGDGF